MNTIKLQLILARVIALFKTKNLFLTRLQKTKLTTIYPKELTIQVVMLTFAVLVIPLQDLVVCGLVNGRLDGVANIQWMPT